MKPGVTLLVLLAGCDLLDGRKEAALRAELAAKDVVIAEMQRDLARLTDELATTCSGAEEPAQADPPRLEEPVGAAIDLEFPPRAATGELASIACAANRCTISRAALTALLDDPDRLVKQVRIVPNLRDGAIRGLKLFGIRAGTTFAAIGLRNGDVVTALDDRPIIRMEDALAAYTALTGKAAWTIAGERAGAPFKLTIAVEG